MTLIDLRVEILRDGFKSPQSAETAAPSAAGGSEGTAAEAEATGSPRERKIIITEEKRPTLRRPATRAPLQPYLLLPFQWLESAPATGTGARRKTLRATAR